MKQFLFIFATILLDVAACGGGGGGHHGPDEVAVSTPMVSIGYSGGSQTIQIMSNTGWTISGAQPWLMVSPMQGSNNGKITITANKNTENLPRACTLCVQAGTASTTVQVTQAYQPPLRSIYGVYTGRLMCGTELLQDNYIVTINKLTGTTVEVIAGFFGDEPIIFNLSVDGNQIVFTNIHLTGFSMVYSEGTLMIYYSNSYYGIITYTGTRQ